MAHEGRYYNRRNLLVRKITEAELAEKYRKRFARERETDEKTGDGVLDDADNDEKGYTTGSTLRARQVR